jgi:hypothetical protein
MFITLDTFLRFVTERKKQGIQYQAILYTAHVTTNKAYPPPPLSVVLFTAGSLIKTQSSSVV